MVNSPTFYKNGSPKRELVNKDDRAAKRQKLETLEVTLDVIRRLENGDSRAKMRPGLT